MTDSTSSLLPLKSMHLPDLPAWFPLAWGWWATAATFLFVVLVTLWLIRRRKKHLAPKKAALRMLSQPTSRTKPSEAFELTRQVALCYFPREQIAQLTGDSWYQFLDDQLDHPLFVQNQAIWQQALYQKNAVANPDELITHCHQWVEQALPPKRRRRKRG